MTADDYTQGPQLKHTLEAVLERADATGLVGLDLWDLWDPGCLWSQRIDQSHISEAAE